MVGVAQLVRALDCGSRGRGFESRHPPHFSNAPVAQLDRVTGYELGGRRFESCRARQTCFPLGKQVYFFINYDEQRADLKIRMLLIK